MRSALILLVALGLAGPLAAQAKVRPAGGGRISGNVTGPDGRPLAAAAVTLRAAADSALVTGAIADAEGRFQITGLPAGGYDLRVSLIGHVATNRQVTLAADEVVALGAIRLEVLPVQINGVEAAAERAPVVLAPDRTVYDVKEMPAADGGSAADVLRHVNELEVDFNGRVTMRGDQAVAIYINGRAAPMKGDQLQDFLKQMPGKAIARVEVIPNPSAKYDPEGMGGIVNIVLRDDARLGLSGSLGTNANTNGAMGVNGRLAFQQGRLTLFAGASGSLSEGRNVSSDLRQLLLPEPGNFYEQNARNVHDNVVAFGDFSVEYKLAGGTTAWTNGYGSVHEHDRDATTRTGVYSTPDQFLDQYTRRMSTATPHAFLDLGAGLKHQIAANRHELTVDLRRTVNDSRQTSEAVRIESLDPALLGETIESGSTELASTWTLRGDYTRPLGGKGELSGGVHLSDRTIDEDAFRRASDASASRPEPGSDDRFAYDERVSAGYVNVSQTRGKLALQAGLRAEIADTEFDAGRIDERFANAYASVFPSFNIAYELDEARSFRLGYSKRVGRPPTHLLKPSIFTDDPTVRMEGNPHLGPNYTHTVNGQFSWVGSHGTMRIAPYFRRTSDQWEQIRTMEEGGIVAIRWLNTAAIRQIGSAFTLSKPASSRFGGSLSAALYHNTTDAENVSAGLRRSGMRWSAGGTVTLKLQASTVATTNLNYMARRDTPQGTMGGAVMSSVGLRHQLLAGKATLNIFVNDPLGMHRFRMDARDPTFVQLSRTTPRMRMAQVSFTWTFGKAPKQQSRRATEDGAGE